MLKAVRKQHVPHHLIIHLDYHPDGTLEIRWDYPFTSLPIPEQLITLASDKIGRALTGHLLQMRKIMTDRLPPVERLRVPHGHVEPTRRFDILTVVIQDGRRDLPVVRLYYTDILPGGSSTEGQVRIDGRAQTSNTELAVWGSLHQAICRIAWDDYQAKFAPRP